RILAHEGVHALAAWHPKISTPFLDNTPILEYLINPLIHFWERLLRSDIHAYWVMFYNLSFLQWQHYHPRLLRLDQWQLQQWREMENRLDNRYARQHLFWWIRNANLEALEKLA